MAFGLPIKKEYLDYPTFVCLGGMIDTLERLDLLGAIFHVSRDQERASNNILYFRITLWEPLNVNT